jgi:uncharacterized protein YlzI (FlbEa/FlbD family)
MTDIIKSILSINPNAEVTVNADDINQIEWLNGTTPIAKQTILNKQIELQAEYEAKQYQRDRQTQYPSIADQLDMLYWDKVNGTENWLNSIESVKNRFPKA